MHNLANGGRQLASGGRQPPGVGAPAPRACARRAFTLIELLVVIFVLLVITAIVIKMATPDTEGSRLRETARQVNSFMALARARAIESGRPAGFRIELDPTQSGGALALYFGRTIYAVEVPPPYAGDTINQSYATVVRDWNGDNNDEHPIGAVSNPAVIQIPNNDNGWRNQVRVGDLVQFNNQGHQYIIDAATPNSGGLETFVTSAQWVLRPLDTTNGLRNPGVGMAYRVTRQPINSTVAPLELPTGYVIDLSMSGAGQAGTECRGPVPVTVMFGPNGSVLYASAQATGGRLFPPSGPIFFLIGTQPGVVPTRPYPLPPPHPAPPLDPAQYNLGSFKSLWVGINHQTGLVATVENVGGNNYDPGSQNYLLMGPGGNGGRYNAIRMRVIGGR